MGMLSFYIEHEIRRAAREAWVKMLAAPGRPLAFRERWGEGTIVVHRDTYADRVGKWRVTTLAPDGEPWGHTTPEGDLAATIREAVECGANLYSGVDAATIC